jgi:rhodanese-related sulfurtransferase
MNQIEFFSTKLNFEIDACDLNNVVNENSNMYEIIDTRSERAYKLEHIKGASNLPHGLINEETVKHFDRSKTYITYCDGFGCNASTKGALLLSKLGFKVKELIGGIDSWKNEGHSVETNLNKEEYRVAVGCGPMCSCHN